jgi:ribosome-associated protein
MSSEASSSPKITGLDFAVQVARLAADNRAEDVVILDLRNLSAIADFFVIATGTSDRQMRAIAQQVEDYGRTVGQRVYGRSGLENATWVLVDYVDVVLHLFDAERRQYYDLELLWGDAPRVEWQEPTTPPEATEKKPRRH